MLFVVNEEGYLRAVSLKGVSHVKSLGRTQLANFPKQVPNPGVKIWGSQKSRWTNAVNRAVTECWGILVFRIRKTSSLRCLGLGKSLHTGENTRNLSFRQLIHRGK